MIYRWFLIELFYNIFGFVLRKKSILLSITKPRFILPPRGWCAFIYEYISPSKIGNYFCLIWFRVYGEHCTGLSTIDPLEETVPTVSYSNTVLTQICQISLFSFHGASNAFLRKSKTTDSATTRNLFIYLHCTVKTIYEDCIPY